MSHKDAAETVRALDQVIDQLINARDSTGHDGLRADLDDLIGTITDVRVDLAKAHGLEANLEG